MGVVQGVVAGEGIKAAAKLQASIQGQQERKNPTKPPAKTAKEGDAAEPDCGGCTFSVGEKVTGDWKGQGQLFPATVRAVHAADHSYDLDYDDAYSESRVKAEFVQPDPYRPLLPEPEPESNFKYFSRHGRDYLDTATFMYEDSEFCALFCWLLIGPLFVLFTCFMWLLFTHEHPGFGEFWR